MDIEKLKNNVEVNEKSANNSKEEVLFEVIGIPEEGSLIVAESLARFRANFQGKIFNENLPAEQWMTSAAELLKEEQPNLENYTAVVLATVSELYEHHKRVEKIWNEVDGKVMSSEERNPWYASLKLEQADAETARRLYRYCFDEEPQGEVEVIKGKYTYIFLLPQDRAYALYAGGEKDPDFSEIGGFAPRITKGGLNICVVNAGEFAGATISHEIEHKRNDILEEGRRQGLLYLMYGDMPHNMRRAIRRRERASSAGEESAKSEILAYCAELELIELTAEQGKAPPDVDKETVINEILDTAQQDLATDESSYFKKYVRNYRMSSSEAEKYKRVTNDAFLAYREMRELYKSRYKLSFVDRMVINILEQFPLHNWPTVARICKSRYNKLNKEP